MSNHGAGRRPIGASRASVASQPIRNRATFFVVGMIVMA